jgi:hypothetical protein
MRAATGETVKLVPAPMAEADLLDAVVELARLFHWQLHHCRPARTDKGWRTAITGDSGFPDIVAVRGRRMVVAELKSQRGKVTEQQQKWLDRFAAAGCEVYCWKPADLPAIARVLSRAHMDRPP